MAITRMVSKEEYLADPENIRVVHDYSGHESGLIHCKDCVHFKARTDGYPSDNFLEKDKHSLTPECLSGWDKCRVREPLYMKTTHIGQVIEIGERNYYDDSDFFARVWDGENISEIEYATTRGWTYPNNAWIDATPEVIAEVKTYREKKAQEFRAAEKAKAEKIAAEQAAKRAQHNAEKEKISAMKNKSVRVMCKKKEEVGNLFWIGLSKTGDTLRVGVKKPTGEVIWANANMIVGLV